MTSPVNLKGSRFYMGNQQGGPIYEVEDPTNSVIEGTYANCQVGSAFRGNISLSVLRATGALSSHSFGFDRAIRIATLPSVIVL